MKMETNNRRVQYLVAVAVSLATMTGGMTFSWTTPVLPKFHNNETSINITESEISWLAALMSPGFMAGSLATRFLSDYFGRRATILGSGLPFLVGTIIAVCATKAWMLYITRALWGAGAGMLATVAGIYIAEIADKDIRGKLIVSTRFMFNFGNFLVMSVGSFVSYDVLNYLLLAFPICFFVACWWIPESPYYLLKEGKVDTARKVLMKLRQYQDEKELDEELSLLRSDVRKDMTKSSSLKELFTGKQYRKAIIIVAGLRATTIMAGSLAVQQYLGRIMQVSNTNMSISTVLTIFGASRFGFGVASSILIDRVGRRPLLILSYYGTCVFFGIVGVYFFIDEVIGIDDKLSPYGIIAFIGILCADALGALGNNSLMITIPAELFPLNVKAVALTSTNILAGLLNFTVVKCFKHIKDLTGLYGVFWFFTLWAFIGGTFSYFCVPETKGKSLRNIQLELQGRTCDEADEHLNKVTSNENEDNNSNKVTEMNLLHK